MSIRPVKRIVQSQPTLEGAGVHLRRAFGFGETEPFDPFLLLDDFRNERPEDYQAGFPWNPHRGIETITYVLAGTVEHGDSLGNRGANGAGDVQWMTAGSGILGLISDGLFERENAAGEAFEQAGVERVLAASNRAPPDELRDRLLQESLSYGGDAAQADDITVVLIRRPGP